MNDAKKVKICQWVLTIVVPLFLLSGLFQWALFCEARRASDFWEEKYNYRMDLHLKVVTYRLKNWEECEGVDSYELESLMDRIDQAGKESKAE